LKESVGEGMGRAERRRRRTRMGWEEKGDWRREGRVGRSSWGRERE